MMKIGAPRRATETELGTLLRKFLPTGYPRTLRRKDPISGRLVAEHEFPPLQDCRDHFEELMRLKGKIDWLGGGSLTDPSVRTLRTY